MDSVRCLLLLAVMLLLVPSTLAQEEACMTTLEKCTQPSGYSELLITGSDVVCCGLGYSMRFDANNTCLCNKTADVVACSEGPESCSSNHSLVYHNRFRNTTECCPQGFYMHFLSGFLNGSRTESCSCSSSAVSGYVVQSFRNNSVFQLHFVNYQGSPYLPLQSSLQWAQKQIKQAQSWFQRLWASVFKSPFRKM